MTAEILQGFSEELEASTAPPHSLTELAADFIRLEQLPNPPVTKDDLGFWLVCANKRLCQLQMSVCVARGGSNREGLAKRVRLLEAEVNTRRAMLRAVNNGESLAALLVACAEQDITRKNNQLCGLQQELIRSPRSQRKKLRLDISALDDEIADLMAGLEVRRQKAQHNAPQQLAWQALVLKVRLSLGSFPLWPLHSYWSRTRSNDECY